MARFKVAECHPDRKAYATGLCMSCYRKKLNWRNKNPEKAKANEIRYREKAKRLGLNKLRRHEKWDKFFGWDAGTHKLIWDSSEHCAVCHGKFSEEIFLLRKRTDHCHKTNVFRGIIHHRCNTAIGLFEDDPYLAEMAMYYLQEHEWKKK